MEMEQEKEWVKAQSIEVSVDLVSAAKDQLKFLAVVDRNRHLYDGPALQWAIYRYNAFWLPLLDKQSKNPVSEDPLVVPLDCEWIWHCHRLNPVRYKSDCEQFYGRILDSHNIISSVHGTSKSKSEEIWRLMYPEEPYELDYKRAFVGDAHFMNLQNEKFTSYDLKSAVKRQVPFGYQVSRPHVSDDQFLQEAVARYKGFLYLIKINKKNLKHFFVPTYDVDLIWHSHQLHPTSYCDDLCKLLGKVMEHDDTDSDRTKGSKLDTGFSGTTKKWEDTFGLRYWKAGAMNRGTAPTPVTHIPFPFTCKGGKKSHALENCDNLIQFPHMEIVEVLLEILEIKNIPESHKGDLRVVFGKKQLDKIFNAKRTLPILSESGQKQVAIFECEPCGEFLFELVCCSQSNVSSPNFYNPFGSCSLSLKECLSQGSQLSINKWIQVVPKPGILTSKPILLHVSLSFTPPTLAPHVFHLKWPQPSSDGVSSFDSLSSVRKVKHAKGQTCVTDINGNVVLNLQMRNIINNETRSNPELLKEVQYLTDSGETHTLAEFKGNEWCIKGIHCSSRFRKVFGNDGHLFELVGHQMVRLYSGRKLAYEPKHCEKKTSEQDFMTAIEFSNEYPYGRAIAIIDFKHGILKVNDEGMILTCIILAFILSDILKREDGSVVKVDNEVQNHVTSPTTTKAQVVEGEAGYAKQDIYKSEANEIGCGLCTSECVEFRDIIYNESVGGCSAGGCSGHCGKMIKSGGCGIGGGKCSGICGVESIEDESVGGKCSGNCSGNCGGHSNDNSLMADCAKCYQCGVEAEVAAY